MKKLFKAIFGNKAFTVMQEQIGNLSDKQKEDIVIDCAEAFGKYLDFECLTKEQQLELMKSALQIDKGRFPNRDYTKEIQEFKQELGL